MLEIQRNIYTFLSSTGYELHDDHIKFDYTTKLESYLSENNIQFEKIRNTEIHIAFHDLGFNIFEDSKGFLKLSTLSKSQNALIKNTSGKPISIIDEKVFIDFNEQSDNFFYRNAKGYVDFIYLLKTKEKQSEDGFHFIDYFNEIDRRIVLTSLSEKSRLIIIFSNTIPDFDSQIDYSNGLAQFSNCFDDEHQSLSKFLKCSLIKYASRYENKVRSAEIFKNLTIIVEDAKMNFEIFINNLSIDNIRKDYDEYKSKYFNEVSDILKNVTQKIIGFPIVIASTLFAVEKVKDNTSFLWILVILVLITTVYLILLLRMNFQDLGYIEHLSVRDYDSLKENLFFVKYPDQFLTFKKIKDRISSRIRNLFIISEIYFWSLSLSNIAIICLILNYLGIARMGIILLIIPLLFVLIYTRNSILKERDEESK
jgi:hypothetical protein